VASSVARGVDDEQIALDIERTSTRHAAEIERALRAWCMAHATHRYMQGMSDVAATLWVHVADAACLAALLTRLSPYYERASPWLADALRRMRALLEHIDAPLATCVYGRGGAGAIGEEFAVRWILTLWTREFSAIGVALVWDTLIECSDDDDALRDQCVVIGVALLLRQRAALCMRPAIEVLSAAPSRAWSTDDVRTLIAEAYLLRMRYVRTLSMQPPEYTLRR
jgi:hypothetical protein